MRKRSKFVEIGLIVMYIMGLMGWVTGVYYGGIEHEYAHACYNLILGGTLMAVVWYDWYQRDA